MFYILVIFKIFCHCYRALILVVQRYGINVRLTYFLKKPTDLNSLFCSLEGSNLFRLFGWLSNSTLPFWKPRNKISFFENSNLSRGWLPFLFVISPVCINIDFKTRFLIELTLIDYLKILSGLQISVDTLHRNHISSCQIGGKLTKSRHCISKITSTIHVFLDMGTQIWFVTSNKLFITCIIRIFSEFGIWLYWKESRFEIRHTNIVKWFAEL